MFLKSDVTFAYNYIYPFDPLKIRFLPEGITALVSITPDYSCVLKSDLRRIKQEITFHNEEDKFVDTVYGIIDAVEAKADKIKKRQSCNEREHFLSAFSQRFYIVIVYLWMRLFRKYCFIMLCFGRHVIGIMV